MGSLRLTADQTKDKENFISSWNTFNVIFDEFVELPISSMKYSCFLLVSCSVPLGAAYYVVSTSNRQVCDVPKLGANYGEATMFQEEWVHGKTGACGFESPFSNHAEGFFTAVGTADWEEGFACGTCAELEYNGNVITVNVVDRCGACSKGWFDLGGPAWRALTSGALPGHIYGVKSRWVSCPASLTGGSNLHVYVKPGSHPWDARFQPVAHTLPVRAMQIEAGTGLRNMEKCENYMFCKPRGITLHGLYSLRISSDSGSIEVTLENIPEGKYIDTGTNNGGACSPPTAEPRPPSASTTTTAPTTTTTFSSSSTVDCSVQDGLYPDPHNCKGFIKCAQGDKYFLQCGGGLYFDIATYNCNWRWDTNCMGRPTW